MNMKFGKNVCRGYLNEVPKTHNYTKYLRLLQAQKIAERQVSNGRFSSATLSLNNLAQLFITYANFNILSLQNSNWLILVYGEFKNRLHSVFSVRSATLFEVLF